MEKVEKALQNHKNGYNCAQSVACVYAKMLGMDEEAVFRLSEGFGLGMGSMETCGAVTAMVMVAGMKESDGNLSSPATKRVCYQKAKQLIKEFSQKNGSIICGKLKGVGTGKVLRSCDGCIEDAVSIIEKQLFP